MPGKSNFVVRGGADFSGIKAELTKTQASLGGFQKEVKAMQSNLGAAFKGIGKIVTAAFAAISFKNFITDSRAAYTETAQNETKLATVMRTRMQATDEAIRSTLEFMSAQQKLGVVSASSMAAGAQELATYVSEIGSLQELVPVLNNIATQQYGVDVTASQLQQTATMLGKVMDGQLGGLSRWGYSWSEAEEQILLTGTEMERAAVLAKVVGASVGDMNYALAQTDVGRQKQLANAMEDVKTQFGAAFNQIATLFIPALQKLSEWLAVVANLARQVAQWLSAAFGRQITANDEIAASASAAADAQYEVGDAIADAAQEAKKSRAGFDVLNQLSKSSADAAGELADAADGMAGVSSVGTGFDFGVQEEVDTSAVEEPLGKLSELLNKLKDAAQPTVEAMQGLWETVKNFATVTIPEALYAFYDSFLEPVGKWVLGEGLPRLITALKDMLDGVDWGKLNDALRKLGDALAPFAVTVGQGLLWFYENVLMPLSGWVLNNAVPLFLEAIAAVIPGLEKDLKLIGESLGFLWEHGLKPLAGGYGESLIILLEWIRDNGKAVEVIITALGAAFFAFKSSITISTLLGKLSDSFFILSTTSSTALTEFSESASRIAVSTKTFATGIATAVAGLVLMIKNISDLIFNWSEMDTKQKALAIGFAALGAAAIALGVAIATGLSVATLGIGALVAAITGAVIALGAFIAKIITDKDAIKDTEQAANDLAEAKQRLSDVIDGNINAVDAADRAYNALIDAQNRTELSGRDLFAQVQAGTLNYANMNTQQREVYKAYVENERAQRTLTESTKELNDAKKAETIASFENQLAITAEIGSYNEYKAAVIQAFNEGKISADEARDLIEKSMSRMSRASQQTFMEDLPADIADGLDPKRYESTGQKLSKWFGGVADGIKEGFNNALVNMKETWNTVGEWFNERVTTPIKNFFGGMWDGLKSGASDAWEGIKSAFSNVVEWFEKNMTDKIKENFKNAINGIIGFAEGLANGFIKAINWIISGFNKISFDVPDWVPLIGGKTFGFSIPSVNEISIPRLATGTVAEPNNPFLAMIGDNKREPEVVSPLSTIEQAVRNVLSEGGASGTPNITIIAESDDSGFIRHVRFRIKEEDNRQGSRFSNRTVRT